MISSRVIVITVLLVGFAYVVTEVESQEKRPEPAKKVGPEQLSDPFGNSSADAKELPGPKPNAETDRANRKNVSAVEKRARKNIRSIRVESPAEAAARMRIEQALSLPDKFQYPNVALGDVVHDLSQRFGIPVILNKKALDDAGVGSDTQINLDLREVSLRSALSIMLSEHDLTYRIQNEVLIITTHDEAESVLLTTIFDVSALLPKESDRFVFRSSGRASDLINLITTSIAQDTWSAAGGAGTIQFFDFQDLLVVSQTQNVTDHIEYLLANLKENAQAKGPVQASQQRQPAEDEMIVKIYEIFRHDRTLFGTEGAEKQSNHSAKPASFRMVQFGGGAPNPQDAIQRMLAEQKKAFDVTDLAEFIPSIIEPATWGEGKGAIGVFGEHVLVRQYPRVHEQVAQLLADLDLLKPYPGDAQPVIISSGALPSNGGGGFFSVEDSK